jgi:hypothetical protein
MRTEKLDQDYYRHRHREHNRADAALDQTRVPHIF